MANQSINLNLIPSGIAETARVSQYDIGRIITFTIYQGTGVYTPPAGTSIEVHVMKGDNKICIYTDSDGSGAVSLSGSTITLNTTQQMTAASGEAEIQFRLKKNGNDIGTLNCTMFVQRDPAADGDISESDLPVIIAEATEQMQRAEAAADEAEESKTAAQNAKTAAESAQTAAETAQTAAETAQTAAETAQSRAEEAADKAEAAELHPPYIGANGNWYVYNVTTHEYTDSGIDASITVEIADITMLQAGSQPYVTNTGTNTDPVFHLFIPIGTGISGIQKTGTAGLVDTYTITYTDGTTSTFTVTNGANGADGAPGEDGRGIAGIQKTGTAGLVDTYTITYTDGTTSTFTVTNGADGAGSVSSVNDVLPIGGNVTLNLSNIADINFSDLATGQTIVYNASTGKWENADQTGGHIIMDKNGTTYAPRRILQIKNARVEDDAAGDKTVVTPEGGGDFSGIVEELEDAVESGMVTDPILTDGGDEIETSGGASILADTPLTEKQLAYFKQSYVTALILSGEPLLQAANIITSL